MTMAQNYQLTGRVDEIVHVNENFHLRYTVNTREGENFTLPTLPDGLEKVYGPSQSVMSSTSIVNGHATRSEEVTLTYILSASRTGKFTIPPAQITVNGRQLKSQQLTVQVIDGGRQQQGGGSSAGAANMGRPTGMSRGTDFYVSVIPSKRRVVEFEPVFLTYRVIWHPDVAVVNIDNISLELQNVFMEGYNDTQEKSPKVIDVNGRTMVGVDWKQYVIYPQKSGQLHIPAQKFNGYIKQDLPIDPFDPFTPNYREVSKALTAQAIDIQVDPLPERPADFSGGVGRFTISATMEKTEVKENVPITMKVTVKGCGNLNMLKEPVVSFPPSFDTYDTKSTDNYKLTSEGLDGELTYEFVAVPQKKGDYTIGPARLVYFDTSSRSYRTLQTDSFQVKVEPGDRPAGAMNDYTSQEEIETLGNDIRHIKTGDTTLHKPGETFFASQTYLIVLLVMILVFVTLLVIFRQRAVEHSDIVKLRGKKANTVATKRLRKAAKLMRDNNPSQFYDEVLRALWGYVGDKLNMPASQLSQENISDRLHERQVDDETIAQFLAAIDECEFERYAPGDPKGNMNKVYEKSMTAIEHIESNMKRKKKTVEKALILIPLFLMMPLMAGAITKAQADASYNAGNFEQAVEEYTQLLQQGVSSDLYYNLGNAWYRTGDLAHAILNYERALLLNPADADAKFNLQLARSHTADKVAPESEMFFVTWYRALVNFTSTDNWARLALGTLALAIILVLLFLFSNRVLLRKLGFFGGLFMLFVFLLCNLFAWQQKRTLMNSGGAIVMKSPVPVMSSPSETGTNLFVLHEGTRVNIVNDTMGEWTEIRLPDGRQGWIESSEIEKI